MTVAAASTLQGPRVATTWAPPPPTADNTPLEDFQTVPVCPTLRHVDDPEGRRIIEGWASLEGVAWDRKEVLASAFEQSAREYLEKNPILLWNHCTYLPIGRVLSLTLTEQGLYMRAEIFRAEDADEVWGDSPDFDGKKFPQLASIKAKCDEVWWLVRTGQVRGLSVRGGSRGRVRKEYSEELGTIIQQFLELIIYEISVAPIQVHPGTRIEAVNTIARSLTNTHTHMVHRALTLQNTPDHGSHVMDMKELEALQQKLAKGLAEAAKANGGTLPKELVDKQVELARALGGDVPPKEEPPVDPPKVDPPAQGQAFDQDAFLSKLNESFDAKLSEVTRGLKEDNEELRKELEELRGVPASRKNKTSIDAPTDAKPKPSSIPGSDKDNPIMRALSNACDPKIYDDPQPGDVRMTPRLAAKLVMFEAARHGICKTWDMGLTPTEQMQLKHFAQIQ